MTTAEASTELGVGRRTVARWCLRLGVQRHGHGFMITPSDLERLRQSIPGKVGNPDFGTSEAAARGVAARRR